MIFLVLGAPGSGKGTQAKLLVKKLGYNYLQTGEVCREIAKEDSPLGRKIDEMMHQKGLLVPDALMHKIVKSWIAEVGVKKGIVFEGYPRNVVQYRVWREMLSENEVQPDLVFYLKVGQKAIIKRSSARRICPQCSLEYNLITKPPKKEGVCDQCQAKLIHRKDDYPEVVERRIKTFNRVTRPLVDVVRKDEILEEVDGERSIEAIHQDIMGRIKKYQAAPK
jgi:adenylate kinase